MMSAKNWHLEHDGAQLDAEIRFAGHKGLAEKEGRATRTMGSSLESGAKEQAVGHGGTSSVSCLSLYHEWYLAQAKCLVDCKSERPD
jgi:hypothetical protein